MTVEQKISIAYQVIVQKEKQADVAKAFRVTASRISAIVKQVEQREGAL